MLSGTYSGARTLRLADGPDEVHQILIAQSILRRYTDGDEYTDGDKTSPWDFGV